MFAQRTSPCAASFFGTAPLHESRTDAFLIARNETTYGDWLAYLSSLPADRRAALLARAPRATCRSPADQQQPSGTYQIILQPITQETSAGRRQAADHRRPQKRVSQDWLKLPAGGISFEDALAYVAWLRDMDAFPGAAL